MPARYEEALADFSQALALDGSLAAAYVDRGALLQKLGNLDTANCDFERYAPFNDAGRGLV